MKMHSDAIIPCSVLKNKQIVMFFYMLWGRFHIILVVLSLWPFRQHFLFLGDYHLDVSSGVFQLIHPWRFHLHLSYCLNKDSSLSYY